MKKVFKVLSIASLVSVLSVTSGCKASQKKVDEVSANLATSGILNVGGEATDFVAIYETSKTVNNTLTKDVITVKRDVANDIYVFQMVRSTATGEESLKETYNYKSKVYTENGRVYIKDMNDKDATAVLSNYSSPYYVYENSKSLPGADIVIDYFDLTSNLYDKYKSVPFNACATNGVNNDVTGIYTPMTEFLECETTKKLFKKEYKYTIGYNTDTTQWDEVTIEVNKESMMTNLNVIEKLPNGDSNSFSLSIDYKDIDLTK